MRVFRSHHVVLAQSARPASVHVDDGVIVKVGEYDDAPEGVCVEECGEFTLSPGLVDTHVHINEPGRADWEGFETATRAAAAGGITTLVDMPLNSVPATTDVAALEAKRSAARGRCHVDVGFWGGIVPGNEQEIGPLLDAGVRGFKCFLVPSGVEEFPCVSEADLRRALAAVAAVGGRPRPVLVHAEDPAQLVAPAGDRRAYATFLATRPAAAEVSAIRLVAALCGEYDVPMHIVHVSSAAGAEAVAVARAEGRAMTAETCPHYLTFTAGDVPDGATAFKCAPPIRVDADREALWRALRQGVLSLVATDHSPAAPAMKSLDTGDFLAAWGGIASLQIALPMVWSGARRRGIDVVEVSRWLSTEPARLCGLSDRKGRIAEGCDADFVLWDPDAAFTVQGARLAHRHPLTPYEGRSLTGTVQATYLRGECVWRNGALLRSGSGALL